MHTRHCLIQGYIYIYIFHFTPTPISVLNFFGENMIKGKEKKGRNGEEKKGRKRGNREREKQLGEEL